MSVPFGKILIKNNQNELRFIKLINKFSYKII